MEEKNFKEELLELEKETLKIADLIKKNTARFASLKSRINSFYGIKRKGGEFYNEIIEFLKTKGGRAKFFEISNQFPSVIASTMDHKLMLLKSKGVIKQEYDNYILIDINYVYDFSIRHSGRISHEESKKNRESLKQEILKICKITTKKTNLINALGKNYKISTFEKAINELLEEGKLSKPAIGYYKTLEPS